MVDALSDHILPEVDRRVADLGFDLVDLQIGGSKARPRLQVRLERPGGTPRITVDDCATVSRALEAWFDEVRAFGERYVLEVSSPGIERPVRWFRHWVRFVGQEVNVRLPGLGRCRARIVGVDVETQTVTLAPHGGEPITLPVDAAAKATLAVDWESSGLRSR